MQPYASVLIPTHTSVTMNNLHQDVTIAISFIAGLAIFLFGVQMMSERLKSVIGDRMKLIIGRFTTNRFLGVLTGTVATAVLDSSSAVCIIVVGLVHARAMSFRQAIAVVMGSNIGTTLSSQIYALDLVKYGSVLLLPGLLLMWLGRTETWRHWGGVAFGLGLVFFALHFIEQAVHPLREDQRFRSLMTQLQNPLYGILAGAIVTAVIQSSSATMGILIALIGQDAVSMPAAIAIMIGAELGTCLDVLMAGLGRSREALRVGVFQLLFNAASVVIAVGFTGPLADLSHMIAGEDPKRQLATAHVLFNILGVLLFLLFTPMLAALVTRLVPNGKESATSNHPGS